MIKHLEIQPQTINDGRSGLVGWTDETKKILEDSSIPEEIKKEIV